VLIKDSNIEELKFSKYVFFSIPTNDNLDVDTLIEEIKSLKKVNNDCLIIIRSTVPVGTCEKIENILNEKICYIPEFVRERCWETDCLKRPYIVGHSGLELPEFILQDDFIECSLTEAEILKMFNNNFAVLRITFANHMYDLANLKNADYNKVVDLYKQVKVDQTYLEANENLRGFGGKCLPKDLDFIIDTFTENNLDQSLFNSLKAANTKWKMHVRKS
jgi:UDPglucose 6-dehydrogenase